MPLYLSGLSFRRVSSTIESFIKRSRTNLACKKLLRGMQRMYRCLPSVAITDGGSWYLVLKRYGIEHKIVSGGVRNYI